MLQILNGDALAEVLPSNILGRVAIVRECLVDGPVKADSIDELWVKRAEFLSYKYPEATVEDYYNKVVPELKRILTASTGTEVYCWFEQDLFCQVNLWFVMSLLYSHDGEIYLVLPDENTSLEEGFSGMDQNQLNKAFRNARLLQKNGIHVLSHMWKLYQDGNIKEALTLATQVEPELPFILPAVQAWKDAIPHGEFPGKPKVALKEIAKELNTEDFDLIFRIFHKRYPIYGYGDFIVKSLWLEVQKEA